MSNKRISDKLEQALNAQMNEEAAQAQAYLALGVWAESNSYGGIADFFYKHSEEERQHMFKFLNYINSRGGEAKIGAIPAPRDNPANLKQCIDDVWEHEVENSRKIDNLVNMAFDERDWATFNFLQWFVKEQIEEENLIADLKDKYELASDDKPENANLYSFDRDMQGASQEGDLSRDSEL